ncbi:MAG: hypothetical protein C7B47_15930 [Sulfobacillus thermosulfidooxidans]|uniref:Uncharacterized protein n=1 Tax=Sulfobacillus thermosulfidooxidans TaxID=28034 RepID=A0A2T2WM13_SULTH|nr:MAG: hypothetical protein C7B47_15930 [Sulfobacillus thermosulfidooxidans]
MQILALKAKPHEEPAIPGEFLRGWVWIDIFGAPRTGATVQIITDEGSTSLLDLNTVRMVMFSTLPDLPACEVALSPGIKRELIVYHQFDLHLGPDDWREFIKFCDQFSLDHDIHFREVQYWKPFFTAAPDIPWVYSETRSIDG